MDARRLEDSKTIMKLKEMVIISILVTIAVLLCSIPFLIQAAHQDDWKKRTTPLPQETKDLLCSSFELSPESALCGPYKDTYALDFVSIMEDKFRPYETYKTKSSEAATYEEVEKIIGTFKYQCEPVVHQADGLIFCSCSYDLRGDRKFVVTILYTYPERAVMRIVSISRFDDY
jgi:hypothetical protein